jgi:hypothetical protein
MNWLARRAGYTALWKLGAVTPRIDFMATAQALDLTVLYDRDETAWLEAMSALAAGGSANPMMDGGCQAR